LHAALAGGLGGYVSADDAYPAGASPHGNGREMIYMSAAVRPLGGPGYTQLLAHEFQHLIHERLDPGEDTWVNEGLSQYAAALVASGQDSRYEAFLSQPDVQLTAWSDLADSLAHYEAASLFIAYLLEQTGGAAAELASQAGDGVEGVRQYLRAVGSARAFEELVGDWAVANLLDQPEGPYGYRDREVAGSATSPIVAGQHEADVRQFGADYLELSANDLAGPVVVEFQGDGAVASTSASAGADGAFWWSGLGDNIDATLTREIDLSDAASATLTFRVWYDIERWFDYAHVAASRDGGRTWTALAGRHTTRDDPLGVAYGPGYTGSSAGWLDEQVDLTPYAGSKVLIRFEYFTDDSNHNDGLAVDNVAVPEIGFSDDGSSGAGWQRAGFRQVERPPPQRFELRLITFDPAPSVRAVALDDRNHARIDLDGLGTAYQRAIIAVVGATDGTRTPARYRYVVTEGSGS
jgi:hypothetical protein